MKTIKFMDKSTIDVSDEQWLKIKQLRAEGANWIELTELKIEFNPNTIAQVIEAELETRHLGINAGTDITSMNIPEITDEQRLKNRKKIKQIKYEFLNRVKKRA